MPRDVTSYEMRPVSGVGIGLRHPHLKQVAESAPKVPWLEVHGENFFLDTPTANLLEKIRTNYPLSCHCVGLSLGAASGVEKAHIKALKGFIERFEPALVSDHLSWSAAANLRAPDLLPVPYTKEALEVFCRNIGQVQEVLGQEILIENPSSYASFKESEIPEWEFITAIAEDTGCGILLDVNNIYVSCQNHDWDAEKYLKSIPIRHVREMHLAGHSEQAYEGKLVLIDSHGARVTDEVWALYEAAVKRFGVIPTLIEWDTDIPVFDVLMEEAKTAADIQQKVRRAA